LPGKHNSIENMGESKRNGESEKNKRMYNVLKKDEKYW